MRRFERLLSLEPAIRHPSIFQSKQAGFIAQDVLPVIPQAISTAITGYYGMNQEMVIPYLVKAAQEQQAEIEALRAELKRLSGK